MGTHPLIFTDESVRQIQAGQKTATRRLLTYPSWLRHQTRYQLTGRAWVDPGFGDGEYLHVEYLDDGDELVTRVRYTACTGDTLWVKETWAPVDYLADGVDREDPTHVGYRADLTAREFGLVEPGGGTPVDTYAWNWGPKKVLGPRGPESWRPPLFMSRWMCRLQLDLHRVQVQRLRDISEPEARAEGCRSVADFQTRWDQINGKRASWQDNPWVWVLSFTPAAGRN